MTEHTCLWRRARWSFALLLSSSVLHITNSLTCNQIFFVEADVSLTSLKKKINKRLDRCFICDMKARDLGENCNLHFSLTLLEVRSAEPDCWNFYWMQCHTCQICVDYRARRLIPCRLKNPCCLCPPKNIKSVQLDKTIVPKKNRNFSTCK